MKDLRTGVHEDFSRLDSTGGSSDRSFGLVMAGFFALVALLPLWRGRPYRLWALVVSGAFLVLALIAPTLLRPLNLLWTRLALLLSKITNPIITGLMFYILFTPVAFALRLIGKDPLRLKLPTNGGSYWIPRKPGEPAPESMQNQF
jgi:hypothetical protein